jgi:hypothetical protein
MAFQLVRRTWPVMLMVLVCPESGFLGRAVRPRPTSRTALSSSVMIAASRRIPVALASPGAVLTGP